MLVRESFFVSCGKRSSWNVLIVCLGNVCYNKNGNVSPVCGRGGELPCRMAEYNDKGRFFSWQTTNRRRL